jgi:steroid 5-alpha reductase family enzyme
MFPITCFSLPAANGVTPMLDWTAAFYALGMILAVAFGTWLVSLARRDVGIVDSMWSLFFLIGASVYTAKITVTGPSSWLVLIMLAAWAIRLSLHITLRNRGEPEDRRYQAIRANNQPHFWIKSLFIIFLLQGFLAWVIGLPVLAAVSGQTPPGPLFYAGVALWGAGMFFEVVADWQLARFRRSSTSSGQVLDSGLWRYSRHPNYFGEALLWWGFYLLAASAGHAWTIFAPVMMTVLLLRVSGVTLLEKDIGERRPAYREYVERTNAFIPGPRKQAMLGALLLPLLLSPTTPVRAETDGFLVQELPGVRSERCLSISHRLAAGALTPDLRHSASANPDGLRRHFTKTRERHVQGRNAAGRQPI